MDNNVRVIEDEYNQFVCELFSISNLNCIEYESVFNEYLLYLQNYIKSHPKLEEIWQLIAVNSAFFYVLRLLFVDIPLKDRGKLYFEYQRSISSLVDKIAILTTDDSTDIKREVTDWEVLIVQFYKIIKKCQHKSSDLAI